MISMAFILKYCSRFPPTLCSFFFFLWLANLSFSLMYGAQASEAVVCSGRYIHLYISISIEGLIDLISSDPIWSMLAHPRTCLLTIAEL